MDCNKKISLAAAVNDCLNEHAGGLWPGFKPVPFILYDEANQVAVGGGWPERYRQVRDNIWVAEGTDPSLMGCTALNYHDRIVAVWDTRHWPDEPDVASAAAGIAHEMFHAFQFTSLRIPMANELLLPSYPHSIQSLALVLEENKLLIEILSTPDPVYLRERLEKIAGLRKLRKIEIGEEYMRYDQCVESAEGTAAYVELRMKKANGNGAFYQFSELAQLRKPINLNNYRLRCYVSGMILCMAADILCMDWQTEWPPTEMPLFDWLKEKLMLSEIEILPQDLDLQTAAEIFSEFKTDNEKKLNDFYSQPNSSFEDVKLLNFDPMNLVCVDGRCLHKHGKIRIGKNEYLLESPFAEVFEGTILNAKQFDIPEAAIREYNMR